MNLKTCFVAASLSVGLGAAMAAPGDPILLSASGPGLFGASFVQTVDDGSLVDYFSFTPASFTGLVSVALSSLTGPVTLLAGQINDQQFGNLGDDLFNFSFQAQVTADSPLTLTVLRSVEDADGNPAGTGSYGVTVNAMTAAVPEPQTWTLLLAGLGAVGLGAAYRRRSGRATAPALLGVQ